MSFILILHLNKNKIGELGASSLSKALEINSSLTLLYLEDRHYKHFVFILLFWWNENRIGDSGLSSLSEGLRVNSSLTELYLGFSLFWTWLIDWLLFNHIPFITILEIQEQHHCQKDWRLIHPSLNCTCLWVYDWIWSIDYYSIAFHL